MKKIVLFLFLLSFKLSFAQNGWIWQNPKPQGNRLEDAKYISSNTIYAIDGYGKFLKSIDNGKTWITKNITLQTFPLLPSFLKMDVLNEQNIFVLAVQYTETNITYLVYKSTDGGNQWSSFTIYSSPGTSASLNNIKFINSSTGYSFNNLYAGKNFFRTIDGGATWQGYSINSNDTLGSLFFANEYTGWAGGPGKKYFKTTNSGNNWSSYTLEPANVNFTQPFFINENTGWIAYQTRFYKTTNGGINFALLSSSNIIYNYLFTNENTGFGFIGSEVQKTNNSGINWNPVTTDGTPVNFLNEQTGLALGSNGRIAVTSNGGVNWLQLSHNVFHSFSSSPLNALTDVDFPNENYGWTLGYNKLFKTTNSGSSWILQPDTSQFYTSVKFQNQNTGIVARAGDLLLTTNSGGGWISTAGTAYSNFFFTQLSFQQPNIWYARGDNNTTLERYIVKSSNGGFNWSSVSTPADLIGISFVNASTGYCTTFNGTFKTTNGAASWSLVSASWGTNLSFINENTGWFDNSNRVYKTTNGGMDWLPKYYTENFTLHSMKFVNELTGYRSGSPGGKIQKTTDGGETFFYTNHASGSPLRQLCFINANTGWAVGEFGAIIKTTTGGSVGVQQISTIVSDKFYLEQNYPNPFNPNTNIEFSLPQKSFVRLKVFDLLGREIANLVNENLSAGKYKYDFNASALPSGIYFYKLETENFSEARKMVLVK